MVNLKKFGVLLAMPLALMLTACDNTNLGSSGNTEFDEYIAEVDSNVREQYEVRSYRAPLYGKLSEGETAQIDLSFYENPNYLMVGLCGMDCTDIDLILHDGREVISEDSLADDIPILEFARSSGTGEATLDVLMYECSVDPCEYVVLSYVVMGEKETSGWN